MPSCYNILSNKTVMLYMHTCILIFMYSSRLGELASLTKNALHSLVCSVAMETTAISIAIVFAK